MGDARLSLEFFNWAGLSPQDQQILDEALRNGSDCVELPWQDEEDCLDAHTLPPEQPDLLSCADTLGPEAALDSALPETLEMQQLYLQHQQVFPPAQYSPGHHHPPVISQEMVCDFTEQHQPPPALPLEGIGKRSSGRRGHHRNKGMHHNSRPDMAAHAPAVEVLERMGEPVRHMPLTYAGGQSGFPPFSYHQPVYYMCVGTAQPFYGPAQGHHPLPFVTAMVSPQPPPHVAMAAPSTMAGEPVTAAHYAELPVLSSSKEEVACPVTTSTSEQSTAVLDDVEPAELLASTVSSETDEAVHEIAKPASPLPPTMPSNVPEAEAAVPVVEQTLAVTAVEEPAPVPPVVNGSGPARRCWADLFKKGSGEVEGAGKRQPVVPLARDGATSDCEEEMRPCRASVPESGDTRLGWALRNCTVNHTPPLIQPRGLENGKNWCYINANLQALLACPAFYNLLYNLPLVPGMPGSNATPLLECLMFFLQSYAIPMVRETGKKDELVIGSAYDPERFRDLLMKIKPDCKKGKQEDAEEFLSFMLNGLHDEMVSSMRSVSNGLNGQCNGEAQLPVEHVDDDDDDEGAWKTVTHRNRHQVTRSAEYSKSPLMDIFGGEMRSSVTADGETSASLQPFFTLQLDIQDGVKNVEEALLHLAAEEKVQNYHSSKSNKEVDALRRTTLEKLPLVLILHLKRFVYDKNGGCKKLMNAIQIPHQLQLDRRLVSSSERSNKQQRCYLLFAVLSHSGERTDKGHYVTDAFHPAGRTWLRCDDDNVTPIAQGELLRFENSSLVPYLLFYRRADTDHQAR
ncbi:ubiquitin carboxyl-terminal hydrolase 10-like [Dermacentor silvarum]|uniref:ubiquitin carboxyl-terminal hydrolase 10-like n=1 Tax=Dermacentor silvarum TaxID=543639 RepID=UPI001899849E|nr:ubiquitin carboxyl-terminal hydrolase 10-like [Dermacentor silvarum]